MEAVDTRQNRIRIGPESDEVQRRWKASKATDIPNRHSGQEPVPDRRGQPRDFHQAVCAALLGDGIPDAPAGEEPQGAPALPPRGYRYRFHHQAAAVRRRIYDRRRAPPPARSGAGADGTTGGAERTSAEPRRNGRRIRAAAMSPRLPCSTARPCSTCGTRSAPC